MILFTMSSNYCSLNNLLIFYFSFTGKLLNIKDTYNHPLFYRGLDEKTGFRTKYVSHRKFASGIG